MLRLCIISLFLECIDEKKREIKKEREKYINLTNDVKQKER